MKIFNRENKENVVYVQLADIQAIQEVEGNIPKSVATTEVTAMLENINEDNKQNFIRFTNPYALKYFQSIDWIIDYRQYRDMSDEDLGAKWERILERVYVTSKPDYIENKENADEDIIFKNEEDIEKLYLILVHKLRNLSALVEDREGKISLPIPLVQDSERFKFIGDSNTRFNLSLSLDGKKVLISKKNGKALTRNDIITIHTFLSQKNYQIFSDNNVDLITADDGKKYVSIDLTSQPSEDNTLYLKK